MVRKAFDNSSTALAALVAVHAAQHGDKGTDEPVSDDALLVGAVAGPRVAVIMGAVGGILR